jgi:arylsulfatase A-like enzyme
MEVSNMKNIIMLMTDTFRYDNLGNRAERPVRTPEIDKFGAERATSIERFYIGSSPTIPQRTDLATGILGWPHYGWQPIDLSEPNHIAEMLSEAGYATQLICDCPHLFPARINEKFDAAFQYRNQEMDMALLHLNDEIRSVVPDEKTRAEPKYRGNKLVDCHRWVNHYFRSEWESFAKRTSETTIRWLENNYKASPFFLWVDMFDPHEPWDPPEYMVKHYDPDYAGIPMLHPNYGPSSFYTPEELRNLWAHYAAKTEMTDRWIGRIFQKIDDLQLWDNSIVILLSDHGISIGEHARTGKVNLHPADTRNWPIYPEVGHAICLMAGGDIPKGQSLDLIAQPIDILPTVSQLASVSIHSPKKLEGRSFTEAILNGDDRHREFAVCGRYIDPSGVTQSMKSHAFSAEEKRQKKAQTQALPTSKVSSPFLVTDRWGYTPIGVEGRPELYDLGVDPLAVNDLAENSQGILDDLFELLLSHLEGYGEKDIVGGE